MADSSGGLWIELLGPVEAWVDGEPVALGGERPRALFAILVLMGGRVVSSDRLIDELWGEAPPARARESLQMHVSRLRKGLANAGIDGRLVSQAGGYLLDVRPGERDVDRWEAALGRARRAREAGQLDAAREGIEEAERMWRGQPLAGVSAQSLLAAERARLEEERLGAIIDGVELDLELGRHGELLGRLEALAIEHPFKERLVELQMLALHRSGRQADALAAFHAARRRLVDELGIEPAQPLRDLHDDILKHSAELSPPVERVPWRLGLEPSRPLPERERSVLAGDAGLEPPPRAASEPPSNLPLPSTRFLGRTVELAQLTALADRTDTRLLTLTGVGGSGKTRLALQLAQTRARDYRDGAWFVAFADITDPELIPTTICLALGLKEQPGATPAQRLKKWLRERELLLLLDNLEQLTAGTAVLGELLAESPDVTLVVTSREPLLLAGEQQYEVPVLERGDAVELFITRAHAVKPTIEVGVDIADRICERLDCLPLAIELAAVRTKALSPAEILARLDTRLPLLTGGPRDAPQRQRTLSATIDWSHELLSSEERRLFARLAVFAGGCTLAAAQAVCGARLDTLQALVDRSLINTDGERYWMLQTLREYALERLEQTGEADELRGTHAHWLIELLDAEVVDAHSPASPTTWNRVAPERENFRAALEWAFGSGDTETVARLAAPLRAAWWHPQGLMQEPGRWLGIALAHLDDYVPSLAGAVLRAARWQAFNSGEYAQGAALAEQGLAIWRELGDHDAAGTETMWIGNAAAERGDYASARIALEETIRLAREHDLPRLLCPALGNLAGVAFLEGELEEARALEEEAIAVGGGTESATGTLALLNLSHLEILDRHYEEAEALGRQALEASLFRGHLVTAARAAMMIAWSLAEQGELERPGRLIGAATAFLEQTDSRDDGTREDCEPAVLAALHAQLNDQAIRALLDEGRSMSFEEALRDAEPTTTRVVQLRPYGPRQRRAKPPPPRYDER